jgi:hypothetical protein
MLRLRKELDFENEVARLEVKFEHVCARLDRIIQLMEDKV